jgi:hypothetical protein
MSAGSAERSFVSTLKGDLVVGFHSVDAAKSCIQRSRDLLMLADKDTGEIELKRGLQRSALAMAITAIDSYMHWLVYRQISNIRKKEDLPKSLARLDLPFICLASLADAMIDGRRRKKEVRPWVQIKNAVQRRLLLETFQSYDQVGAVLALDGIDKAWSRVADKLGIQSVPSRRA